MNGQANIHEKNMRWSELSIYSLNVNGMSKAKLECLKDTFNSHDIVILQETWNTIDRNIDIDGFTSFHSVRQVLHKNAHRGSDGFSIFIKKHFKSCIQVLRSHNDFILCLSVNIKGHPKFAVAGVYFPPKGASCNSSRDNYFNTLMTDLRDLKGQLLLIITGHFNARTGDLGDMGFDTKGLETPNDPEN